jgi:O-antigen/teichoic acid export membrane protein
MEQNPEPKAGALSPRAFARGFLGTFSLRTVGAAVSLATTVILARALGTAGFGVYAYALALVALLAVPAQFGIGTVLMRFCSAYERGQQYGLLRGLLRWSNTVVLITSLLFAAGAAAVLLLFPSLLPEGGGGRTAVWLGLMLLPIVALGDLRAASLTGLHQYWKGQVPEMLVRPGGVLLIVSAVWLLRPGAGFTAGEVMVYYLAASLTAFALGAWWLWRALPAGVHQAAPETEIPVWRRAGQLLTISRGGGMMLNRIDLVFLGALAGASSAGVYRAATALASLIAFGLAAVNVVAAPNFSRLDVEKERAEMVRMLAMASKLSLACALPLVAVLVVFGRDIISVVYGKPFAGAYVPLIILVLGQLFNAATGPVGSLLVMTGQEWWSMTAVATALAVTIPAYVVLVPRFGAVGAASATATGVVVLNGIMAVRAWYWLNLTRGSEPAAEAGVHGG